MQISGAKELRNIFIFSAKMKEPDGLLDLPQLEELDIRGCTIMRDYTPVEQLQRLKVLHLGLSRVPDRSWIKELAAMEHMYLRFPRIPGLRRPPGSVEPYLSKLLDQ